MPDGPMSISQSAQWDFHAQPFLGFTKNGVKREKHPVCGSPVGENPLNSIPLNNFSCLNVF